MTIQLELITPELAQQILDGNTDNRPCKERHVKFLADQMRSGDWQVTGDPIKISASGRLLDGQHRLRAILLSETAQHVYVARHCEEEIFSVLDTGRARSASDVLATSGMKNFTCMAAAIKLLILKERGSLPTMGGKVKVITHAEILDFARKYDLEESTTKAHAWVKRCKLLNPGEWTALHHLLSGVDSKQATDFLNQISTGLNLTEGHPVFLLRTKLQLARDGRFNFTPAERMALTIKAWNALREGKKIGQLTWKNYEEFPEIF
ncbi:hypothetical protein [Spirosoma foliorum]|uniref:ParB/Sulfiredoxin domain-containing protein n=1 Tax=Spirosoma foliorum TaxID=2710596 RepID=A0A7G5H5K4_9BACT|nr:hypothetical protein [Spirosoma foliorum]QMW06396.1 hypothetical protein H3H32_16635 [Spirosoma foliorum]